MIKNVIFDLDGTLLDTTKGVLESIKYTAQKLKYPELAKEIYLKFIGPPVQQSFMEYYGCDKGQAQEAADMFRAYYKSSALLKAVPYDGIFELCESLREQKIRMSVATYKREDYAIRLLKHFHFDTYCHPMHGADDHNVLKKEDIVKISMKEMGGTVEDTVLVGDTNNDAVAAEKAGVPFIAVTYGFGFRNAKDANLYGNIGTAANPLQIADIVFNYEKF